ncbi:hypothetical protein [Evansella cellulosilytica]|uniref:Uncharacterized protein n=1 Tax=Evansella cellulosilytica (strain ATCC 21833 / DSM 2522 / FERM P-1141 / JCM 9156 / N-4) TaxID=649639 RepID=E6TW05_EVAC2|nr:hypothetical protein [Evansella cellulosilytica]ADU29828.1 hypothetical protein Bcell_1565 [Evansella cellulosilytica DSM 2522]
MKKNKVFVISCAIFLILLLLAIPFHIDSTKQILDHQHNEEFRGFHMGEDEDTRRFQPRQYIKVNKQKQIEIIEEEL